MANLVLRYLSLSLSLVSSAMALGAPESVSSQQPYQDESTYYGCGKPEPIGGYEISFQGTRISLPKHVTITIGSSVAFSDDSAKGWEPPYTTARYASVGDMLLVLTQQVDCIDMDAKRLFIVKNGQLLLNQRVWTGNWHDGFFLYEGRLSYWSDWFCHSDNKDRKDGQTYIYALADNSSAFERLDVEYKLFCGAGRQPKLIEFRDPPRITK